MLALKQRMMRILVLKKLIHTAGDDYSWKAVEVKINFGPVYLMACVPMCSWVSLN